MVQRDFITREIERISQVLGGLLARLAGMNGGDVAAPAVIRTCAESLRTDLGVDLFELLKLSDIEVIGYLSDRFNFTAEHFESLLDLLLVLVESTANFPTEDLSVQPSISTDLRRLALILADYLENDLQRFSFSRLENLSRLRAQ